MTIPKAGPPIKDPRKRFSDRVTDYVRFRPGYPPEVLAFLESEAGLAPGLPVADVGSGTGIFTRCLLEHGNPVFAVEPNREMREAAEAALAAYPGFKSVNGSAEETGLPEASVAFVTVATAFHWFELTATRREFHRILVPGGKVAVLWNERLNEATPFMRAYGELVEKYAADCQEGLHQKAMLRDALEAFFEEKRVRKFTCGNRQTFDFDGVKGRLLSSSYAPREGAPNHEAMIAALKDAFDRYQEKGLVRFEYETEVTVGEL